MPQHTPYVYLGYNVCSATGRAARVRSVRPMKSVGVIRVVDWAVHPGPSTVTDAAPGVASSLPGFSSRTVTAKCNHAGTTFAQLAICVEISSSAAGTTGFLVNGTQIDPFGVTECVAATCHRLLPG